LRQNAQPSTRGRGQKNGGAEGEGTVEVRKKEEEGGTVGVRERAWSKVGAFQAGIAVGTGGGMAWKV